MKRILTSLHGNEIGLSSDRRLIMPKGGLLGRYGLQFRMASPDYVCLDDDFNGDALDDNKWNYVEGTDTATADGAIVEGVNGVLRLTGGDSAGTVAADGSQLNGALNWKANQGDLLFLARVNLASITGLSCFVGFTDTKSLEAPIQSAASADTITTNATDAVGFMFDTSMTTDNWWLTGVANNVDATKQDSTYAPVAATYEWLGVTVSTAGVASFWRNGLQVGTTMTGAVTATVALTPTFIIWPRTAAAGKTMDIDSVHVSALRV